MTEAVQNPVEQQAERSVYVAPPATLPMPALVMVTSAPAPAPAPEPVPEQPEPVPVPAPVSEQPEPVKAEPGVRITPSKVAPPPLAPEPASMAARQSGRRLVGVVVLGVVLLVGLGVGVGLGRNSSDRPDAAATRGPAVNADATATAEPTTPSAPATAVATPSPASSTPGRPVTPTQALALTEQQALNELKRLVTEDAPRVADLVGAWVPQVSSKCVGISVDIGPNWIPDGVDDTSHVTLQQILAFHISLHNRFDAVTLLPTQAGLLRDQASAGPCAGSTTWMSAVPERFASAADANAWCATNMPPIRECAARYFARPGERSTQVLRH